MNKTEFDAFIEETKTRLEERAKSNQVYESLPMRTELFLELYEIAWEHGCMHGGQPSWRTLFRNIAERKLVVVVPEDLVENDREFDDFDWIDVDGRD